MFYTTCSAVGNRGGSHRNKAMHSRGRFGNHQRHLVVTLMGWYITRAEYWRPIPRLCSNIDYSMGTLQPPNFASQAQ